jgi:acetyl esterase
MLGRMHPQARVALGAQPKEPLSVDNLVAVRRSMVDAVPDEVGPGRPLPYVADVDAGGVPARLYRPVADPGVALPTVVYAHGGGWVLGDLDTHDGLCRELAGRSGWAVLAVDYRRSPEAAHPAALDDLDTALTWLRGANDGAPRPDGRLAVAGDSAGGYLAAAAALRQRDAGTPLAAQVLICPVIDPEQQYPELDEFGLDRDEMRFFWDVFAPAGVDRAALSLLKADLTGLPPAVIVTAELDILALEGERYAGALMAAGVPVVASRYLGLTHNFVRKLALFDAARAAVAQIAAALPE